MVLWFSHKYCDLSGSPISSENVIELKKRAFNIFDKKYNRNIFDDVFLNHLESKNLTTKEWLMMALKSKSGQDYICAMTYLINSYPMYSLRCLDNLILLISPSKKRDCFKAMEALFQLFNTNLLPKRRTLIPLTMRPHDLLSQLESDEIEKVLCLWYFENELKQKYNCFIKAVEHLLMSDAADNFKRKALTILSDLASKNVENRKLLLSIMINKVGDRSKVLASAVIHKLRIIAGKSFRMTALIIEEVRSFLFRPNLLERAKYYALVLLSCLQLRKESKSKDLVSASSLALILVKVYASFFHSVMASKEIPERLVNVLLSGLRRATPFVSASSFGEIMNELNELFRLVHTASFNLSIQALAVIFQLSHSREDIRDRYYQALYRKLLDPNLHQSKKNPILLHLVYSSMLADSDVDRLASFTQRISQICLSHVDPGFVVGCLILLSKVASSKENLIVSYQSNAVEQPTSLLHGDKTEDLVNVCNDEDDDEEHFSDAPCDEDLQDQSKSTKTDVMTTASWHHRLLSKSSNTRSKLEYDPRAREPKFSRALGCPTWALVLLVGHTHPTVRLFAKQLLDKPDVIRYTGNPFEDFGLVRFLDRFAYKKPKTGELGASNGKTNEDELNEGTGGVKKNAPPGVALQRQKGLPQGPRSFSVDSKAFRNLSLQTVPVDEHFFHNYFTFVQSRSTDDKNSANKKKSKQFEDEDSDSSVSDAEFDAYLEKHEKGLVPNLDATEDDVDPEFSQSDFSDDDSNADEKQTGDWQNTFAEMDGVQTGSNSKHHSKHSDESDDEIDDFSMDEDDSSDEDELPVKSGKRKLNSLFASADEVGYLYDTQESNKKRKHRMWEEKHTLGSTNWKQKKKKLSTGGKFSKQAAFQKPKRRRLE